MSDQLSSSAEFTILGPDGKHYYADLKTFRYWVAAGSVTTATQVYSQSLGKWAWASEFAAFRSAPHEATLADDGSAGRYSVHGSDGTNYRGTADHLRQWATEGRITPATQVYLHAVGEWVEARRITLLDGAFYSPGVALAPSTTTSAPSSGPFILLAVVFGVGIVALLFVGLSTDMGKTPSKSSESAPRVWTSSDDPSLLPASGPIRNLHNLREGAKVGLGHRHLVERWQWDRGSAYVWFNREAWNSLSYAEQRQVLDMIASSTFMDGLVNMWLYVGSTELGRIKPRMSGGFEFSPAGR